MKHLIIVVFLLLVCSCFAFSAMPPELVLYMSFDKNTIKGETVMDLTAYGNNGTIKGDPKIEKGYSGEALDFTNDTVEIPTSKSLAQTASAITLEAWVFARTQSTNDIISKWDNAQNGIIHFEVRAGGMMRFCMRNKNDATIVDFTSAKSFATNKWVHIAETFDGSTAKIYFDGEEVATANGAGEMRQNDNCKFWIGSMYATDRWFDGLIDEVRIWSKALNPDEIKKAMDGSLAKASVDLAGKITYTWGKIKENK